MHINTPGRIVALLFLFSILCGCGGVQLKNTNTLSITPGSIAFGNATVGASATANVALQNKGLAAVQVSQLAFGNSAFSTLSQSTLPATIAPGAIFNVTVQFSPTAAGPLTSQLEVVTNQSSGAATGIGLSGTGVPAVTSLSCNLSSISGSGSVVCTVTLNAAAASGGLTVNLSSSDSAVNLPSSVTIPANATSAQFNASVTTVSSAQSATLTASVGGSATTFALQLVPNGATLTLNATNISFGTTALNTPLTQSLVATASGTLPVSIGSATLSGTGFTIVGATFPITLNPGQSITLNVQFDPKALGATTGQLSVASSALTNGTAVISLSGTGVAFEVELTWNAPPESAGTVSGYRVYRSTGGSSAYQLLNSNLAQQTTYTDTSVQGGQVYDYVVESVDGVGDQSSPSNTTTVTVP